MPFLRLAVARVVPSFQPNSLLARENRLRSADDFRLTMRSGRKVVGTSMVLYLTQNDTHDSARFGFVVSKAVGGAVQRNLVKRRFRSAIRNRHSLFLPGQHLVIKALPGSPGVTWNELSQDLDNCLARLGVKSDQTLESR